MKKYLITILAIGILLLAGCSASDPNESSVPSETDILDSSISATVSQTDTDSESTEAVTIDAEHAETTPVSDRDETEEAKRIPQAPTTADETAKQEAKPKETLPSQSSDTSNSNVSKKPSESNSKQNTTPSETTAPQTEPPKKEPEKKQEEPKVTPKETEPTPPEPKETEPSFDINYWVQFAKDYARSVGLVLNPEATSCWDNPIGAGAHCIYLERDIKDCLNYYSRDEDITDVWIWSVPTGNNCYDLMIGYA